MLNVTKDKIIIEQFSNLDLKMQPGFWDITVHVGQGSTLFVREILDGIGAKPGGVYIHCGYSHRRALPQSRQVFHAAPWGASDPKTCCNEKI